MAKSVVVAQYKASPAGSFNEIKIVTAGIR